jgi:hypothetical protein
VSSTGSVEGRKKKEVVEPTEKIERESVCNFQEI